ncbi:MAG: hypothetical protein E7256_13910 [Lachnospiraceae bacterium]|nr:hypothetical protein [Lachnospiraceae bacterium]
MKVKKHFYYRNVTILFTPYGTGNSVYSNMNNNGYVYFTDVPNGRYSIYECFGYRENAESMVSMNNAMDLGVFTTKDLTIEFIRMQTNPSLTLNNATRIASITSNNHPLTVNSAGSYFLMDAPCIDVPLELDGYEVSGENLITKLSGGTWTCGESPNNTDYNLSPASSPFPVDIINFGYMKCTSDKPNDGYYSVININAQHTFSGNWFDMADHTTVEQTGNFIIINGNYPNKSFL